MNERYVRKDLQFLENLLNRWGPRYISWIGLFSGILALPSVALGIYYARVIVPADQRQLTVMAITLIITVPVFIALRIIYLRRISRSVRAVLMRPHGQPLSPDMEVDAWQAMTTMPVRVALFSFGGLFLIVVSPLAAALVTFGNMRAVYLPYVAIGSLIIITWVSIFHYFFLEWAYWPLRRRLLPRSPELQRRHLVGPGILHRMLLVYTGLLLTALLMVGSIVYQKSMQAVAPGANPVLVLQSMQGHVLFISLLTFSLGVIFSLLLARSVANPLRRLAETMAEVERGDLSRRGELASTDETGRLTIAFNQMVSRLQELQTGLEEQVAARTAELARRTSQLEAAAIVARRAAEIRDVDTLLNETVQLISDRFGFYHAGIFLLDERGEYAVLQAASSEGGQRMLARGHRLAVGKVGIVGYVAATGQPRIVLDVGADAVFFDNPDLPLTRSEMALPLKVGERVIGVLDVQSDLPAAFTEEDVAVLQTMADQIALAIENARALAQMGRTVQELEQAYGEYTRKAWQAMRRSRRWVGRRYRRLLPEQAEELPEEARRALSEGRSVLQPVREEGDGRVVGTLLAVPMKLRGQVIGALNMRFATPEVSPETVQMVEEVANRLALALENARLLEESRLHAERDRRIAEITARVRASLDPEAVLRTAAQQLGAALGVDRVIVQMIPGMMTAGEPPARSE